MVLCSTIAMSLTRFVFFFFNDTATTEIYTLSLHDALPISRQEALALRSGGHAEVEVQVAVADMAIDDEHPVRNVGARSEEHTSELQSQSNLVCRLLLEKKKYIWHRYDRLVIREHHTDGYIS